jgi:hypothetical protein
MGIQRAPQSIPSDGRHFGPGTLRRPSDTVGPAIVTPAILPAAQSSRARTAKRNAADSTNARAVNRGRSYQPQGVNYGTT